MLYGLTHSFLKTFFISSTTLLTLNVLALTLGRSLPFFLYRKWIDWIAVFIFFFFGIILLHDSYNYDYEAYTFQSELSNPLIENREESQMTTTKSTISNLDQHTYDTSLSFITSLVLAECGDKSQITSIVIGALYDFKPVLLGTSLALLSCIILAVFIGNYISQKINKNQINLISGIVFILFGISYLIQLLI
jgi:putative Ca2+/H+ antiporter (TMEM165/GDT1 family)